ncbi:MAG: ribosome biogenesis GTPase Der [Prevotellamassilia sp.]|uniref:ribosome biogenesis GTPase Der n=1 Tax=Alloprevotella sp. TaxID=1872471 RepID=UPI002ECD31C8|nr:ribosome biogenesis GTPase Der [Prevotellamassilia sp.]
MSKLVAIVGRPNVGKSTLFNRLTGTRQAIVSDEAGTTRDRQYGKCEWGRREFSIVDTGGWVVKSDDIFEGEIRKQVTLATEEADVVLFVVDIKNGITDLDAEVASILRRTKVPVILCANKTDNNEDRYTSYEFYKLGLGDPFCISAITGSGTGDLLDLILEKLGPEDKEDEGDDNIPRFSVVGRPNAGKSSIINAFLGEDRNIVTNIAGTTRDSILTRYTKFGFDFYLVDTAGIRRKNKVSEDLEFYSVMRAIRSIENSDVCILMIDATRGIESQDLNIVQIIQKNFKSIVVVVNKWDLVEDKSNEAIKHFENAIRSRMAPFVDFPIIFASALTKQRIFKVLETAKEVYLSRKRHISTSKLNEELLPLIESYPPPSIKGKYIKIKYCAQIPNTQIPSFVFYANLPQYVKEPYKRFLENKIRERWDFLGTPINIFIRQK